MRISDWSSDVCSSYLNFTLAAGNSANNPDFAPQKAKTIEAGVKWDALDGALAFNAAVFQTKVLNEVNAADPSDIQSGSKRVRGFELSVVGNITDAWSISAGYGHQKTKVTNGNAVDRKSTRLNSSH